MNSRKCDVCNIDVHRASYQEHLRSKRHLEKMNQNEIILPDWLFQESIENKIKKLNIPKSFKQIARNNVRLDDEQLKKELAKKMLNPYYFTDRILKVGFEIDLDSHPINHTDSKLTSTPNPYNQKIMEELSVFYARLINQYKFKHQTVFSARFDKQNEDNQVLDETELFVNFNISHNLTQTDIDNFDVKSPLEYQFQQQEMKKSG